MKFSKKAQLLFSELIPAVIATIIIALVLFLYSSEIHSSQEKFEAITPQIQSNYPIVFVHTFLHLELTNEQKEKFGIEVDSTFMVKDLIQEDHSNPTVKEIYNEIKEEYVDYYDDIDSIDSFTAYTGNRIKVTEELLVLSLVNSLEDLDCVEDNNYFFYLPYKKSIKSQLVVVKFKTSSGCALNILKSNSNIK